MTDRLNDMILGRVSLNNRDLDNRNRIRDWSDPFDCRNLQFNRMLSDSRDLSATKVSLGIVWIFGVSTSFVEKTGLV
jgi:hypothetical protein